MHEEIKEYTMDDLEDIIREYSSRRPPEEKSPAEDAGEIPVEDAPTARFGAVQATTMPIRPVKPAQDTMPIAPIKQVQDTMPIAPIKPAQDTMPIAPVKQVHDTKPIPDLDEDVRLYQPTKKTKPVPPVTAEKKEPKEPIAFPPSRLKQLREKLESGPQQRYADLSERGLGRLRVTLMAHGVLLLGAVVMALLAYRAHGLQLKLMVAGQLLILLLSALAGYRRIQEGVAELLHRRFRMNSLLPVSFLVCFLDGLLCLGNASVPFGPVFALQMLMAQWGEYQHRQTEMSQMDTLRKASDLIAVVKTEKYYKGQPAYQTTEGHPEDFMDHYRAQTGPEIALCNYALGITALGAVLALLVAIFHGIGVGLRAYAAALLAAVPASAFVCIQRPAAILERRMHKLGTVLCGWRGLQEIEKHGFYPLEHGDLFPASRVKLNGVRFYGERNVGTIVSYVAALMAADGGALAAPFEQLRASRNARVCKVEELTSYPDGIGGQIDGLSVIAGRAEFMENMGVTLPEGTHVPHAVYAAVNQSLCAVFVVSFTRSKSSATGLRTLCDSHHIRPILVDCDFVLTEPFLEEKLDVDVRRMQFPDCQTRMKLARKKPNAKAPAIALATRRGLAQRAYAVTGGAALRSAWRAGAAVHILGGSIGFLAVAILALQGSLFLLTPYNLLLYGCVWMIPGLLMAEWTRSV